MSFSFPFSPRLIPSAQQHNRKKIFLAKILRMRLICISLGHMLILNQSLQLRMGDATWPAQGGGLWQIVPYRLLGKVLLRDVWSQSGRSFQPSELLVEGPG